jgi:hypothetical protein
LARSRIASRNSPPSTSAQRLSASVLGLSRNRP